jgi:hypothetical protein
VRSSTHPALGDPGLSGPVPQCPSVEPAARLDPDPDADADAVHDCLDEFDATLRCRAEQRRAATRELVAELHARDGVQPSPERVEAEAEAACAQERDERLAAELRRLVAVDLAAARQARAHSDEELDGDCQAALNVLATAPPSLEEFQPAAERSYGAEQVVVDGYAAQEADAAGLLEEARDWQLRRRRRLRRKLAEASRGRQAAVHRLRLAAVRLAAVRERQAQRDEWLAQSKVHSVLSVGVAALRQLADRAQAMDVAATAELPVVDQPVTPGGGQVSAASAGLVGCWWRRCRHAATVVISFQAPHLLGGTSRGYCDHHAAQAAGRPGAVLTGAVGPVPVQQALPGLDPPAEPTTTTGGRCGRGGGW